MNRSGPKELYQFLKSKGLIRHSKEEYEEVLEVPAQSQEATDKNKRENDDWLSSLSPQDLVEYQTIFGE